MLNFVRFRPLSGFWLLVPTLLWSLLLLSPVLCIDPFLFPLIEQKLKPGFVVLLRATWAVLFAATVLLVWNIAPDTYLFYLAEALPFAPKAILALIALATALLVWFVSSKRALDSLGPSRKWFFSAAVLLLLVKAAAAGDIIHSPFVRQIVKSPLMASARTMGIEGSIDPRLLKAETPDATFDAYVMRETRLPPQVILMLVESWGEQAGSLAAIAGDVSVQGFHVIKHGFTTYRGSTLSGEFRELCARYVQPSNGMLEEMKHLKCAPEYLKEKGYDSIGMHAYAKSFYARNTFWRRFGIEKQVFANDLPRLPQCPGPFSVTCDEDLIAYGIDKLDAAKGPAFLYMLTLSSHEPIDQASLTTHGKYFTEIPVAHHSQVITRRAISSLIEHLQNRKNKSCTQVYIAGDHQPPSASAKGGIFETDKVPYMLFNVNCPADAAQ